MTVANSIARPGEALKNSSSYSNKFHVFITSLKNGYKRLEGIPDGKERIDAQSDYIDKKTKDLADIVDEYNKIFLPARTDGNTQGG
jgi:hypothetical protein